LLSGVAVVVAAAFWTLLWGPVGVRRLRRRLPQAKIVDGFWTLTAQEG
jgi:hypothetical protein